MITNKGNRRSLRVNRIQTGEGYANRWPFGSKAMSVITVPIEPLRLTAPVATFTVPNRPLLSSTYIVGAAVATPAVSVANKQ